MSRTPQTAAPPEAEAATDAPVTGARVTRLQIAPIKGTRMHVVDSVSLSRFGAAGDRRFFLVDERDRRYNGKNTGALQTTVSHFDEESGVLSVTFADGSSVSDVVEVDQSLPMTPFGTFRAGWLVEGPWAPALSRLCGRELRLVMTDSGVDRGTKGAVTLVSSASLDHIARRLGVDEIDPRRFRMTIQVDGIGAHEEDRWVGREADLGAVRLRFEGHAGRCLVTCRDPESGELTLPTLDAIREYRKGLPTTEPFAFGIYARVLEGGAVRLGDTLTLR